VQADKLKLHGYPEVAASNRKRTRSAAN
jgi:aspartyl protease family protein